MSDKVYAELPTNINTLENEKFNLSDDGLIEIRAGEGTGTIYTELPRNINTLEKEKFVLDDDGRVAIRLSSSGGGIVKYANLAAFPVTGKPTLLYLAQDTGILYTWETTIYVAVSTTLALGETSTTAYRGDRGKTAYDHSQTPHDKAFVGLSNVDNTSDANKPISTATQTALDGKVDENVAIVASTNTKITYDSKGLVTAGTTLSESDIPALSIAKTTGLQTTLDAKIAGPAVSIDNSVPKFDGITGKILQDGTGVYIDDSGNLGINEAVPTARLEIKGSGATSATSSLLVKNSAGTTTLQVKDDGQTTVGGILKLDSNEILITGGDGSLFSLRGVIRPTATNAPGSLVLAPSLTGTGSTSHLILQTNANVDTALSQYFGFGGGFSGAVANEWNFGSVIYGSVSTVGFPINFIISNAEGRVSRVRFTDTYANFKQNTGIGLANTSTAPTARLEVKGSGATSATKAFIAKNSAGTNILTACDCGSVGVGTDAPTAKLDVAGGTISTSNTASLKVVDTSTSLTGYDNFSFNIAKTVNLASASSASDYGSCKFDTYVSGNTGRYMNCIDVSTRMGGSFTYSNSIGMVCRVGTSGASSVLTNAVGIQASPYCLAGTITNFKGINVTQRVFTTGTVVNAYGIYIEDVNYGTTKNFSLYLAGGKAFMGGDVGIGTETPTSKLQVVGLPEYADNAAALAASLTVGAFYHTAGVLKVVI